MPIVTRRDVLGGAAAAAATAGADPVSAAAPLVGIPTPGIYRYRIGEFELTALYDGIWYRPITKEFIRNAPFTEVEHALDAAFMPHDKLATPFTTLIVNTGKKLVLIDTGTGGQISPTAGMIVDNWRPPASHLRTLIKSSSRIFIPITSTASRIRTTI